MRHFMITLFTIKKYRVVKALFAVTIFLLCCRMVAMGNEVNTVSVVVEAINYETEEGYVVTNKGIFYLPNPRTEVYMQISSFDVLINKLKLVIGKRATLSIYENTIVGISSESEGINVFPEYKKRKKKIYENQPVKVSTVITLVIVDTYRLTIKTPSGDYCIFNDFEFSDYYKKAYNKLNKFIDKENKLNIKADIFYHKIENSYECIGEVEDIILREK